MSWSNCLVAALVIRFRLKGSHMRKRKSDFAYVPHYVVCYKRKMIDFVPYDVSSRLHRQLWYKGFVRRRTMKT